MKNKYLVFVVVIVLLVIGVGVLGVKYYNTNSALKNNTTLYCVMEDQVNDGKMEFYYDFKDNHVYRYMIVSSYKMTDNFNVELAKALITKNNEAYKGIVQSFWTDNNTRLTTEVYYLDLMTEEDYSSQLGNLVKDLKDKSRQEIIDSIVPMSDGDTFKCN